MLDFHGTFKFLLHAANLQQGTEVFTSSPKEGVLRIFFALKYLTASAGFEPANLGTKGQHATPRPPKPLSDELLQEVKFEDQLSEMKKAEWKSLKSHYNFFFLG
jgi:hypothetical protein